MLRLFSGKIGLFPSLYIWRTKMAYLTRFFNSRRSYVRVYELSGEMLVDLAPGESADLEAADASGLYARYSEVEYTDGGVKLIARSDFEEPSTPPGLWRVELLNRDGGEYEGRSWPGLNVALPKAVPVVVFVPPESPLAQKKRLEIRWDEEWIEDKVFHGYYDRQRVLRDCWEDRAPRELEAIAEALEAKMTEIENDQA
jgi:hypothetical protein